MPVLSTSDPSVPMPSLPRIRPRRGQTAGVAVVAPRPRLAELDHAGLTWIHLESPSQEEAVLLSRRFRWHPSMSKT